jgi:hypothetical protein
MKFILSLFLIISCLIGFSQWKEIGQIEIAANQISFDEFGNHYYTINNTLYKCDSKGEVLKTYSNSFLGNIHSFDVSDPFRLLLFFSDFNQIIYLDNKLSELRAPISLDDLDLYEADAVCASHRGGFWAYISGNNQLLRFNKNLKLEQENYIITDKDIKTETVQLIETSYYLFLVLPPDGIFIYDGLGSFVKKIPSENLRYVHSEKQKLFFTEKNKINIYDLRTGKIETLELPIKEILGMTFNNNKLYLIDNKKIRIFSKE